MSFHYVFDNHTLLAYCNRGCLFSYS